MAEYHLELAPGAGKSIYPEVLPVFKYDKTVRAAVCDILPRQLRWKSTAAFVSDQDTLKTVPTACGGRTVEEETLEGALTAESALPFLMEGLTKPVEDEEAWTALLAWYLSDEVNRKK